MVFNCPKAATQYHDQHNQLYYEATMIIWDRETTAKMGHTNETQKHLCTLVNQYK